MGTAMSNTDMRASLTVTADLKSVVVSTKQGTEGFREMGRAAESAAHTATAAVAKQTAALEQLSKSVAGAGGSRAQPKYTYKSFEDRGQAAAEREQADRAARAYKALEESLNPVIRAQRELAAAEAVVNSALASGQVSKSAAARSLEQLRSRYDQFALAHDPVAQSARAAEAALAAEAAEFRNLALALDPAARETERFALAQERLRRAVASGVVSKEEGERLQGLLAAQRRGLGGGGNSGAAGAMAANLSFQMNDIAMMTALGQSPMMVMLQQGPQVAQIFSQVSAAGIGMGTALASAFKMVVTPWGLMAMAVIGGGAAIAQGMMKIIPPAKTLEERLDALNTAFDRYKETTAISAASSADLARDFGAGAEAAQGLYAVLAGLSRLAVDQKLKATGTAVREMVGMGAADQVIGRDGRNFTSFFGLGSGTAHVASYSDEIKGFQDAIKGFENAEGIEGQIVAMQTVLEQVERLATIRGGISDQEQKLIDLIKEQADVLLGIQSVETARDEMRRREIDSMVRGYDQQAELSRTILQYGEGSAEVDAVRASHLRSALGLRLEEMKAVAGSEEALRAIAALESDIAAGNALRSQERQKAIDALSDELGRQEELSTAILAFGKDSSEVEELRARHARELNSERLKELNLSPALLKYAQQLFEEEQKRQKAIRDAEAARKADLMLTELREEAEIRRAIVAHGRDSLQVKELELAAERRTYEESLRTLGVSQEKKRAMMAEWDARRGLGSVDPFGSAAAANDMLRGQRERLAQLRLEQALLGQTEAVRGRILALWKAESEIRKQHIDASGARAAEIRAQAIEEFELGRVIDRTAGAWKNVQSSAESAIDGIVEKLMGGDIEGALEALAADIGGMFTELAISNPLKNAILGTNLGTIQDVGGLSGIWGRLTGKGGPALDGGALIGAATAAASMTVTTPVVHIATAGIIGGLGSPTEDDLTPMRVTGGDLSGAPVRYRRGVGLGGDVGVQQSVWSFFASKGLKPHQIAAIMGNVSAESGFNPLAVGDAGKAHGLFQWNNRAPAMFDAIGGRGNIGDVKAQLEFAWKELLTSESGVLKRLLASDNVHDATRAFVGFERPSGWSPGNPEGAMHWDRRLGAAEMAMARFGTVTVDATKNLDTLGGGFGVFGNALASGLQGLATGGPQGGLGGFLGTLATGLAKSLKIPGFAAGGRHIGGLRMVGENGPELEYTGPSTIVPADLTRQLLEARQPAMRDPVPLQPVNIQQYFEDRSSRGIKVETQETTDARGQRQQRFVLSDIVAEGIATPGGRASRTFNQVYGMRRAGTKRT